MATDSTKYISLGGLDRFLYNLKDKATYDDDVVSNKIILGTAEIDPGLRFPGEPDMTGDNVSATNKGLVLSNSVLKSRGREIKWNSLDDAGTTNLNFITSPGVYTITGDNTSGPAAYVNLPYAIKAGDKFQVRLTVTKIVSKSGSTTYENLIQHVDYIDSSENYGSYVRRGNRYYTSNNGSKTYTWYTWEQLNKDTVYTHPNSGVINDKDISAGVTEKSCGPSDGEITEVILSHGDTFKVPYVAVNRQGHIFKAFDVTVKSPLLPSADGDSTAGIIKTSFSIGSSISLGTPDGDAKDRFYAIGVKKDEKGDGPYEACVHVPWTEVKAKSLSTSESTEQYLLGIPDNSTVGTSVIETKTHTNCYMKEGYLYSNGEKVDMSTSMALPCTTKSSTSSVTLAANTCTYMTSTSGVSDGFSIGLGAGKSGFVTTYKICFSIIGSKTISTPNGVKWLNGTPPTNLSAGFYEIIFTKYRYGNLSDASAPITATWTMYS